MGTCHVKRQEGVRAVKLMLLRRGSSVAFQTLTHRTGSLTAVNLTRHGGGFRRWWSLKGGPEHGQRTVSKDGI